MKCIKYNKFCPKVYFYDVSMATFLKMMNDVMFLSNQATIPIHHVMT